MDSFISYYSENIVNDVMDGVELDDAKLRYIESIGTSAKVVICSKIAPNLRRFRVQIACQ